MQHKLKTGKMIAIGSTVLISRWMNCFQPIIQPGASLVGSSSLAVINQPMWCVLYIHMMRSGEPSDNGHLGVDYMVLYHSIDILLPWTCHWLEKCARESRPLRNNKDATLRNIESLNNMSRTWQKIKVVQQYLYYHLIYMRCQKWHKEHW